jgi:hypothetical protein
VAALQTARNLRDPFYAGQSARSGNGLRCRSWRHHRPFEQACDLTDDAISANGGLPDTPTEHLNGEHMGRTNNAG